MRFRVRYLAMRAEEHEDEDEGGGRGDGAGWRWEGSWWERQRGGGRGGVGNSMDPLTLNKLKKKQARALCITEAYCLFKSVCVSYLAK